MKSTIEELVAFRAVVDTGSITAAAEWCRRATPEELAAFGLPYHPLLGRYRVPSEKTLRSILGRLDPGEISAASYNHLRPLLSVPSRLPEPLMPDGGTVVTGE